VVVRAGNGAEAVVAARETQVDVALVDLRMPGMGNDLAVVRELSRVTHVLMVTASADPDDVTASIDAGALGYWVKQYDMGSLVEPLRRVARGEASIEPSLASAAAFARPTSARLTPRQRQVTEAIANGQSTDSVAEELGIAQDTVRYHLAEAMQKLGISSRAELALYGIEHGIVAPRIRGRSR
jgi:DNA-binding NarL/FixJ family response regulator